MLRVKRLAVLGLTLALAACGGEGDDLPVVTARGKATHLGLPLGGATLVFAPADGKYVGNAITNDQGEFEIQTNNQRGALPGDYKVVVTKFLWTEPKLEPGEHSETAGESKLITPAKYSRLETTDLQITVPPEGSSNLEVSLK